MTEYIITLKTQNGYIFDLYVWAESVNMARDKAKRLSECEILGNKLA